MTVFDTVLVLLLAVTMATGAAIFALGFYVGRRSARRPPGPQPDAAALRRRGELMCPHCGAPEDKRYFDQEGSCVCENGHDFWASNALLRTSSRRRDDSPFAMPPTEDHM